MFARQVLAAKHASLRMSFLGAALPGAVNFTRATAAAAYDVNGLVIQAASGAPRFDFHPTTHAARGLLLEDARTNICLRSAVFGNAAWVRTSCNVGADAVTDPSGALTYDSLTASAGNATALQTIAVTSGSTYTFAIDLVRITGAGNIQITMDGGTTWTTVPVTGTLTRFSVVGVAGAANIAVGVRIVTSGDAVGAGGAQLEPGEYASTRLTTAAASTARNRDTLSIDLPAPFYRQNQPFSAVVEAELGAYSNAGTRLFRISDGTAGNAMVVSVTSAGLLTVSNVVNSVAETTSSALTLATGVVHKIGVTRSAEGLVLVANGQVYRGLLDRPTPQNVAMTTLDLSPAAGSGYLWLRRLNFWRNHLPSDKLAALTA